ncbi:MAG: hypothetical protein EOP86_09855 [Verrucomicrobiaceae bacterium]|nr:MAG: hypothetical protein EOP86_09855 [Verrucomicrobiaceae bacterium]
MAERNTRKVRPDNVLRQQPEERQLAIFNDLKQRGAAAVRESLRAEGLDVGMTALYNFAAWWRSELRFLEADGERASLLAKMLVRHPAVKLEKLEQWADALFLQTAVSRDNLDGYVKLRTVMERAKQTRLDARRLAMLEEKERKLERIEKELQDRKAAGGLTPEALELMESMLGMMNA